MLADTENTGSSPGLEKKPRCLEAPKSKSTHHNF